MKHLPLLFNLLLTTISGFAQHPFLELNKEWISETACVYSDDEFHPSGNVTVIRLDTVRFNQQVYYHDTFLNYYFYEVMNDTVHQVFRSRTLDSTNSRFELFYNFRDTVGGTNNGWEVLEVDSIQICDGTMRRRMRIDAGVGNQQSNVVEGIGNLIGFYALEWLVIASQGGMHPDANPCEGALALEEVMFNDSLLFSLRSGCNEPSNSIFNSVSAIVAVYPNPASDVLHIVSAYQQYQFQLIDVYGRVSATFNGATKVDVSNIAAGVYQLRVFDGTETEGWQRVVVE